MHKTPITLQQWLESLPNDTCPKPMNQQMERTRLNSLGSHSRKPSLRMLARDFSMQSDDCSHCSSVESVLEFRKADPEAVLLGLGFGPANSGQNVSRIPPRFLQPSKLLQQIDMNKFLEEQGEMGLLQQQQFNNNNNNNNSPMKVMQNNV